MRRRSAKSKARRPKARSSVAVGRAHAGRVVGVDSLDRIAAIAIIFFLQFSITIRPFVSEGTNGPGANFLIELPIIFACCLWLISMALKRELRFAITRLEIPIAIFVVFIIISVFTASYKRPSFILAVDWISFIILFFTVANISRDARVVRLLLAALIASAFVVSLYGLYQHFCIQSEIVEALERFKDKARDDFPDDEAAATSYVVSEIGRNFDIYIAPESLSDFEGRVRSGDVYSTFILANNLAGFLILVFPVQLGFLIDRLRRASKNVASMCAAGMMVVVIITTVVCLYLTGSKGGWIALALGMIVFCGLSARGLLGDNATIKAGVERVLKRKYALYIGALILILAIVSAQLSGKLPKLGDYPGSMAVRTDYWRAAWAIVKDHPWLGVGLDNYGVYSTAYKGPEDGESRMAHNDFIQIWAEIGTFGFLAYCSLWIAFLILCFRNRLGTGSHGKTGARGSPSLEARRPASSASSREFDDRSHDHLWIVGLAAGGGAFCFNYIAQMGFDASLMLILLLCAAWLVAYVSFASDLHLGGLARRSTDSKPSEGCQASNKTNHQSPVTTHQSPLTNHHSPITTHESPLTNHLRQSSCLRYGIITGMFCFLIHSTVDFDLYVHGVAQNVWMLMAFALVTKSDSGAGFIQFRRKISTASQLAIALAATLFVAAFALVLVPRAFTAQIYLENGGRLYANGKVKDAIRVWEKAAELDPFNASIQEGLAMPHVQQARALFQAGEAAESRKNRNLAQTHIKSAIERINRAIKLNPRSAKYHATLGDLYERAGRMANAIKEHKKATQLFPSKPIYWRHLARAYQKDGRLEEAKNAYAHAVDLNKRQRYPRNELSAKERDAVERELALITKKLAEDSK